ncbi:MAG: Ig-like domain-containing protein [Ruminococcus sp.]|nr:Ig-like domain-containing protein [Ruminococcus sp.]
MVIILCVSLCACGFSPKVASISLSETEITLNVGDSKNITVTPQPNNANAGPLTWSSTNTNIVKVENGTIFAIASGNAVISAKTESGIYASCNITVKDKSITKITLNKNTASVKVGSKIQLEANVTPADAPTNNLRWTSSDDGIATVNSEGYVTGIKTGTVNIFCKAENDVEASCTITVKPKDSSSSKSNNDNNTIVYNYYSYGHYHPNYTYSASDFVFPDSSYRKLSRNEIATTLSYMSGYSPAGNYAQDAINEIYARNGYIFKTDNIRAYYESKPWYYADPYFTTNDFSSIEKYNMALLEEFD